MIDVIKELLTNEIVVSVLITGLICVPWKVIDLTLRMKRFDWRSLFATGGMPSSHSAFVCTLGLSIGFVEGFVSSTFLLAGGVAIIVIRDAFGVRRTVDTLAKKVNQIIKNKKVGVKEILHITGHTPVQVVVGALIGLAVPLMVHFVFY